MTARIHSRDGMKRESLSRLPSPPRIHRRPGSLASERYGCRWRSLPVEGSKAFQRARGGLLGRIFSR
jgi:hypothetical protein